jgi:multiple sugar transport system permease protein
MSDTERARSGNRATTRANQGTTVTGSKRKQFKVLGRPLGFEHWALLPLLLFFLAFVIYPVFELVSLGFSTVTLSQGGLVREFSGLSNFYAMLEDRIFWGSLLNTVIFVAAAVILQLTLGTLFALLVERARFLSGMARNVIVWPAIVTPVAVGATWWLLLNIEFGLFNYVLDALGLPQQAWLASTTWALPTLIVVDVWHWTPVVFLFVLAGLANIDHTLYEAARIDGASEWRVFRNITLPLLAPTLVVAAITRIILGFKVFDEIFLLTGGGPGNSTEVISTYIQEVFVQQTDFGYGAFLSLTIITILIGLFAIYVLSNFLIRKLRHEG